VSSILEAIENALHAAEQEQSGLIRFHRDIRDEELPRALLNFVKRSLP
jgi:hypothetical protein